jgi:FkbM family methyltransferase
MGLEIQTIQGLGREFHFVLNSAVDHIQSVIRSGTFYELQELELIAELVDRPRRILDVGANLGNHTLYFAHRFDPELTIPVEPNPRVVPLLRANLGLNWHHSFDLSLVGYGLSDHEGYGTSHLKSEANLGGARLIADDNGSVPIVTGDNALEGISFDLIKIDVEGMENQVLTGMAGILARSDALVFVEVLLGNIDATIAQMRKLGYLYREAYQRYGRCLNLIFEKA